MMSSHHILEILLRGACAGWLILFAARTAHLQWPFQVRQLAVLFAVGTAAYAIVSGPSTHGLGILPVLILGFIALLNSVFFWWFSISLFDDNFRWRVWHFLPPFILVLFFFMRVSDTTFLSNAWINKLHQSLIILMMAHAIGLAILHRSDDLIDKRRQFRMIFAIFVGLTGVAIAIAELHIGDRTPPHWLTLLHAVTLALLTGGFLLWLLPDFTFLDATDRKLNLPEKRSVEFEDLAQKLQEQMQQGVYREEGLKIADLASKLRCGEHTLRQLINKSLGYRNFSAFLNEYRIRDAKDWLSDPGRSRDQITQIAFGLGFGSLSPFNRTFKLETGLTPKEYRRKALKKASSTFHETTQN